MDDPAAESAATGRPPWRVTRTLVVGVAGVVAYLFAVLFPGSTVAWVGVVGSWLIAVSLGMVMAPWSRRGGVVLRPLLILIVVLGWYAALMVIPSTVARSLADRPTGSVPVALGSRWTSGSGDRVRVHGLTRSGRDRFDLVTLAGDGQLLATVPGGRYTSADGQWVMAPIPKPDQHQDFPRVSDQTSIHDGSGAQVARWDGWAVAAAGDVIAMLTCAGSDPRAPECTLTGRLLDGSERWRQPVLGRKVPRLMGVMGFRDVSVDRLASEPGPLPTRWGSGDYGKAWQLIDIVHGTATRVEKANSLLLDGSHAVLERSKELVVDDVVVQHSSTSSRLFWAGGRLFQGGTSASVLAGDSWQRLPQSESAEATKKIKILTDGHTWVTIGKDGRTVRGLDLDTGRNWQVVIDDARPGLDVRVANGTVMIGYRYRNRFPLAFDGPYRWTVLDAVTGSRGSTVLIDRSSGGIPLPGRRGFVPADLADETRAPGVVID